MARRPKKIGGKGTSDIDSLLASAKKLGLEKEIEKIIPQEPKLSALQRLSKGLGSFNPAEAVLTGIEEGFGAGLKKYGTGIVQGIGSAITGKDYEGERRYFSDVAEKLGIENGILKFGIGFIGDVLLDPTTYFGGAIAKGVLKAASMGGKLGVTAVGKVAPDVARGLELSAKGAQDAFGAAFVSGYKSTKGAQDFIISHLSKQANELLERAGIQLRKLGVKGLTEEQLKEVGLKAALGKQSEFLLGESLGSRSLATKLVSGKSFKGGVELTAEQTSLLNKAKVKFDNPLQQQYFEKQQQSILEFAKRGGVEDPYAVYFPYLKKQVVDKFSLDVQKAGIEAGSATWNKEFKNILKIENIELDPRIAYFTREAQIIVGTTNREILQGFVKDFGKPLSEFASEEAAKQAGFSLLRENGGFGKAVGYVGQWDKKLFNDLIRPEFQTINMLAKATGFDAATSLFKRGVTGLFLPFHIRNWVSGIIQNYEVLGWRALLPKNMANGLRIAKHLGQNTAPEGKILLGGAEHSWTDIFQPFRDRFSGDTFYNTDYAQAVKAGAEELKTATPILSKGALKETIKTAGLGTNSILFKAGRVMGQFIEHQQKAVAYITALDMGKSIPEALKLAEKAGFDYRVLTKFESQILKRIVPFYSFTRKNIELQLRTMGENPQRINQIIRTIGNIGEIPTEEEKAKLPDWLKEGFTVKLGENAKGLKQYLTSFGTPIEQFTSLFSPNAILNTISQMNPILKTPIELGIGKDSFREQDLKEVYDAKEYSKAPKIIKDLLDIKEVDKPTYKKVGDKLIKTGTKKQYIADPNKLLIARGLFTSRGVSYLDQIFDGDLKGFAKVLKLFSGLKPYEVDTEVTKALKDKETKRALEDLLIKMGEYKRYESIYKPK